MDTAARSHAFARLHRDLLRRRFGQIELRLRVEIALLAALVGSFVFWQARIPFDGFRRGNGTPALAALFVAILAGIVVVNAMAVAWSHARDLRRPAQGPPWLALPIPAAALAEHLRWEARLRMVWGAALAPGFVIAAAGLVPAWFIALAAIAFAAAHVAAGRAGTWLATTLVERNHRPVRLTDALLDLLSEAREARSRQRLRRPGWSRLPAPLALWTNDVRLATRPTAARSRLVMPATCLVISCAVWWLPMALPLARFIAFAAALVAAASGAEFIIALAGGDPLPVLRSLPLRPRQVWAGRALWVLLGTIALVIGQIVMARGLEGPALSVHAVWLACASVAIGLLGVHYGMTLGSVPEAAQRFLTIALSISMAASLMIPLLGWIVLLTYVIHSARRVPAWATLETER